MEHLSDWGLESNLECNLNYFLAYTESEGVSIFNGQ
jgi:hypothetical protein